MGMCFSAHRMYKLDPHREGSLCSALNLTDESVRPLMRQRIRETTGAEYVFSLHT